MKNHWDLLLRNFDERKDKEFKKLTTQKTFMKPHIVQKVSDDILLVDMLLSGTQEIVLDLSMMETGCRELPYETRTGLYIVFILLGTQN